MGVKSTRTITRERANNRFEDLTVQVKTAKRRARQQEKLDELGRVGSYIPGLGDLEPTESQLTAIYHHVDAKLREERWRIEARVKIASLTDQQMEGELEWLNDEANGGEGFENYIISERADDER